LTRSHLTKLLVLTAFASVALFASAPSAAPSPAPTSRTIDVRAWIDGRSDLVFDGSEVHWHHYDFVAPGRWPDGAPLPTYIDNYAWFPTWPDVPDAKNFACNCDSSDLFQLSQPVSVNVSLTPVSCRDSCSLSVGDGTITVDFNDDPTPFAAWYEVKLTIGPAHALSAPGPAPSRSEHGAGLVTGTGTLRAREVGGIRP
jgi:hypothetical protein